MLNEILKLQNTEYVHEITRDISLLGNDGGKMGFRCAGSTGEWHASDRIRTEMEAIGLSDVSVETFPVNSWEPVSAELTADGRSIPVCPYAGTTGTPDDGITAPLVYVGDGSIRNYEGLDVEGKIVLCTFDMLEDYWVNFPAYQAMKKGAAAFVCCYCGDAYSLNEGAIGCFDSQMVSGFPVVNISREDGACLKACVAEKEITVKLSVDVRLNMKGESSNVIGYIPGKDSSSMIILAGHMDGFFHAYQDDALAIGINLDIARSILASGYEPEHTIAVVAHGSEEYGVSGSKYDWCIGSWNNVTRNHPEWFGKAVAFLNIDAVRPDTQCYNIACTPEWRSFFEDFRKNMMDPPEPVWPGGTEITPPKGPWADGFNFANLGVPELICGGGPSPWSALNYHTQYDDFSLYEEEKGLIEYVTASYTEILLEMDKLQLPPLDFSHTPENLLKTLEDMPAEVSEESGKLAEAADKLASTGRGLYKMIKNANNPEYDNNLKNVKETARQLLECYRVVHRDLMKLAVDDSVVFPHEPVIGNIACIDKAIAALNADKPEEAVGSMFGMDLFRISYSFDEETYRYAMKNQDCRRDDLFWGTGKIHLLEDTWKLAGLLRDGHTEGAISVLNKMRSSQINMLREFIEYEISLMTELERKLQEMDL